MADVWAFPYLPLISTVRIGPFDLVPRDRIADLPAVEPWMREQAGLFLEFHRLPEDLDLGRERVGALVIPADGSIREEFDRALFTNVRRAVLAALLDGNPMDPSRTYTGTGVWTSDNAILYGHTINEEGRIVAEYGVMSRRTVLGMKLGEHHAEPPLELTFPWLPAKLDEVYADAVFEVLASRRDREAARRLGLAIDWMDVAWRNTPSIRWPVRIVALKSAFEALLAASDVEGGRQRISPLLDAPDAPRTLREYPNLKKTKIESHMLTEAEWWFTKLCFLRNKISHGEEVLDEDCLYQGEHQVMVGERQLRRAVRSFVARCLPSDQPLDTHEKRRRQFAAAIAGGIGATEVQ